MPYTKKILNGGMNADDADVLMQKNEYICGLNISINNPTQYSRGRAGEVSTIYGNYLAGNYTMPAGRNVTIGACEDKKNGRVVWFNWNSNDNHGIYCYVKSNNTVYKVLGDSDVTGGLSFNGTSYIHSCEIVGDMLYWCEDGHEPRRINIMSGMKMYVTDSYTSSASEYISPLAQSVITLIRNPPMFPILVEKDIDSGYVNNFIQYQAFQFSYRLRYKDGETSVLAPWSELINFNLTGGGAYNVINILVDIKQKFEQDVQFIEIVVKNLVNNVSYIIKTYNIDKDSAAISAHNSGSALGFSFYNDIAGIALDDLSSGKLYDRVPIESKTLCIAKNRLMLGNNLYGYDTPTSTSLIASASEAGATTVTASWYKIDVWDSIAHTTWQTRYYVDIAYSGGGSEGLYQYTGIPNNTVSPTYPTSIDMTVDVGSSALYNHIPGFPSLGPLIKTYYGPTGATSTITNLIGVVSVVGGDTAFKTGSSYKLGVVFYDSAKRSSGVVYGSDVTIPERTYGQTNFVTSVNWSLVPGTGEVPSWAKYYSVVMTKCSRTSFFIQLRNDDVQYYSKDTSATSGYTSSGTYAPTSWGTGIKISSLNGLGMGYNFQQGDLMAIYWSGGSQTVKVKGQDGDYVIVDLIDLTAHTTIEYEIFTPRLSDYADVFYNQGQMYPIVAGDYSVTSGSIPGDVTVVTRTVPSGSYLVEAMSPSDTLWNLWFTNASTPNIQIFNKIKRSETEVSFSNVYNPNLQTNGLSTFDPSDYKILPMEMGGVSRLMRASKIQEQGSVVVSIGENDSCSLYLEEAHWFDNNGNSTASLSSQFIGQVNPLQGGFGTMVPESAYQWEGWVYWLDHVKAVWVRYDREGLTPISEQANMHSYFVGACRDIDYQLNNRSSYSAISPIPFRVLGGYDPYNRNPLLSVSKSYLDTDNSELVQCPINTYTYSFTTVLSSGVYQYTPPVTFFPFRRYVIETEIDVKDESLNSLPYSFVPYEGMGVKLVSGSAGTYTATIREYSLDIFNAYDGQAAVWAWDNELGKVLSKYSFQPEWMSTLGNQLVTFNNGTMYIHGVGSPECSFYNTIHDAGISFVHGDDGPSEKVYKAFAMEGDLPDWVFVKTASPNRQITSMAGGEFDSFEGKLHTPILRDRTSPNTGSSDYDFNGIFGDDMIGETAKFQVVFLQPSGEKVVKFVNIKWDATRGQKV